MSTILVVGASGTVGRALVPRLAAAGHSVRAATRDPSNYTPQHGVQPVRLDLHGPSTFEPALEGVDALFQINPPGHVDAHALLAPLVEVAARKVSKIVTMTAQGIDASEEIPFRRLELAVERSGVRWAHLRPSWFAQNFNTYWFEPIRRAGLIPIPAGDSRTAFIDATDIAASAAGVLTRDDVEGRAWELTGPEPLTYAEAAAILSEASGRPIRYQSIDDETFVRNLTQAGLPADYAGLLAGLFGAVRAGVAARVTDHVQTLSGQAPRSLRDYAREHRASFAG